MTLAVHCRQVTYPGVVRVSSKRPTSSERKPHLLYVAWGFPPSRSGGVYRALATANRFAVNGWDVTVLTADRETFERHTGVDPSLEERVDPRIEVVRVPFSWPVQETDLRQWSRFRATRPQWWLKSRIVRDRRPFPEVTYGPWRRPIEAAAEAVHTQHPVDLVVATANPNVSYTAAYHLHRKHGVPYVMDYRDAWQLDVFSGDRLHSPRSRVARWEKRLVHAAAEVWFVNRPILDWHAGLYPDAAGRMHTVANGFDAELAPAIHDRKPTGDRPLVFGYIGTMSPKVPLLQFVRGWRRARESSPAVATAATRLHGYLGYYAVPETTMARLVTGAADDDVSYEGPVGKGDVGKVYDSFDVLLLILGTGRYVTSGKVYEYLATGLPIVSVHDPGNAASDVLQGYPLWFPAASLDADDVADAIRRAAEAAGTADEAVRRRAREFGAVYQRELQLDPRIEALSALAATPTHEVPR